MRDNQVETILRACIILVMGCSVYAQSTWTRAYGGSRIDVGTSVVRTPDGGYVVVGHMQSNDGDFDGMTKEDRPGVWDDIFVMKVDSIGKIIWKRTFGGNRCEIAYGATLTTDSGIVIAGFSEAEDKDMIGMNKGSYDVLVVKYDQQGALLWKKRYGGSYFDEARAIVPTGDNSVVLAGYNNSADGDFADIGKAENDQWEGDAFIMKIGSDGEVLWKKGLQGSRNDVAHALSRCPDGGFIVCGETSSADGHFPSTGKGWVDVFVAKTDSRGKVLWVRTYGGTGKEWGYALQALPDGGYVVAGSTDSRNGDFPKPATDTPGVDTDIFIMKLDSAGNIDWKRSFSGRGNDEALALEVTERGGIIVTGFSTSTDGDFAGRNKGDSDIFLCRLEPDGATRWQRSIGGAMDERGMAVTSDDSGDMVLTGYTSSKDGDFASVNRMFCNVFIIKLDANGTFVRTVSVDDIVSNSAGLSVTPNPVSSFSSISCTLVQPAMVRVEVVDMLGRVVDVVSSGYRDEGTITIPYDASLLASGAYQLRMTANGGVQAVMMLVR